jgi:hypothetical protein
MVNKKHLSAISSCLIAIAQQKSNRRLIAQAMMPARK